MARIQYLSYNLTRKVDKVYDRIGLIYAKAALSDSTFSLI